MKGKNEFLVSPRDAQSPARAMDVVIVNPDVVPAMSRRSRAIDELKYDVHKVNAVMLAEMGLVPDARMVDIEKCA